MGLITNRLHYTRPRGASRIKGICIVEGCKNVQRLKGKAKDGGKYYDPYCYSHKTNYLRRETAKRKRRQAAMGGRMFHPDAKVRANIPNEKCDICQWDKGPCDRHRIEPSVGYISSNVRILCPNCHRLVTFGLLTL